MAWEDREYYREGRGRFGGGGGGGASGGGFGGRLSGHSVTTWLLVLNCVVFVLGSILTGASRTGGFSLVAWGAFSVERGVYGLEIWRFFTYQFLHAGFFHILFNMIGLYFFGPLMEQWWGSRRYTAFYLLCGVSGAVLASVLGAIPGLGIFPPDAWLVGASGSIFGILAACATVYPHQRVQLLFPPIPMSMRTMALVFLGIAALSVIVGSPNAGGQAAHLGGALLGFALVRMPRTLDWADRFSPGAIQANVNRGRFERKKKQEAAGEAEVDRILDKVRQRGIASLTRGEKKTLNAATEARQKRG